MELSPESDIVRAVTPLRLVFLGGLLCVIDVSIDGFDLLPDLLGLLLICVAVIRLRRFRVDDRYHSVMTAVAAAAVVSTGIWIFDQLPTRLPPLVSALRMLFSLLELAAIVAFALAMRWLAVAAGLDRAARSWQVTTVLFVAIYLLPLGLFDLVAVGALVTGSSFSFDLGPAGFFLLMPVLVLPLIHLFVSTSRMRNEAAVARVQHRDGTPADQPRS